MRLCLRFLDLRFLSLSNMNIYHVSVIFVGSFCMISLVVLWNLLPIHPSLIPFYNMAYACELRLHSNSDSLVGKGSNSFKNLFIQQFPLLSMCLTLYLLTLWIILHLHLCWLMLILLFLFLIPSIFLYPTPLWCYRKMTTIHTLLWILNRGQDLIFLNLISPFVSLMVAHVRGSLFLLHFLWYQHAN